MRFLARVVLLAGRGGAGGRSGVDVRQLLMSVPTSPHIKGPRDWRLSVQQNLFQWIRSIRRKCTDDAFPLLRYLGGR